MEHQPVRDAYSSMSRQYIGMHGDCRAHDDDVTFVREHLRELSGPVFDLGCGPGQWTGYLHSLGVDVTGVDIVPEFITHARARCPGPEFRLGSMTEVDVREHSLAGILSWYSTIHMPPADLDRTLARFRRLLVPSGVLVIGFFDGDDEVAPFDHAVVTAYRWPIDAFSERLSTAGLKEVKRLQQPTRRSDRKYAAIAARAV